MKSLKKLLYIHFIHKFFKEFIEPRQVNSEMHVIQRSLNKVTVGHRANILANLKEHVVKDVANYLIAENLVKITTERQYGIDVVQVKASIVVYMP